MRLSHIHEDGISRRDFLQKSGGGLASLLVGGGLSPEVASVIASPNPPQLIATIITGESGRYEPNVADSLKDVAAAYNTLRRLLGRNANIGANNPDGDTFSVSSYINPEDVPKLLNSGTITDRSDPAHEKLVQGSWVNIPTKSFSMPDDPSSIYVEISSPDFLDHTRINHAKSLPGTSLTITSVDDDPDLAEDFVGDLLNPEDLIKAWWDNWEQFGISYLDKGTLSLLRKNGIDPIRFGVPEGYNNPKIRKNATGSSEPEEWEGVEPEQPEEPEEPEQPEKLEKPHDYDVASSMHQWMENKSRFKAELDKALSHIHEALSVSGTRYLYKGMNEKNFAKFRKHQIPGFLAEPELALIYAEPDLANSADTKMILIQTQINLDEVEDFSDQVEDMCILGCGGDVPRHSDKIWTAFGSGHGGLDALYYGQPIDYKVILTINNQEHWDKLWEEYNELGTINGIELPY